MEIVRDESLEQKIFAAMKGRRKYRKKQPKSMQFALFEVITCLNKSYLKRFHDYPIPDSLFILFAMGNAAESILTGGGPHAPALYLDEVYMGVDSPGFRDTGEFLPWECKLSFTSSAKEVNEQYQIQILSYMKGYTTNFPDKPPCTEFALPCIHIMGDWRWVFDRTGKQGSEHPLLRAHRCKATQEEIDDNWDWVQARKGILQAALINDTFPSEITEYYAKPWMCTKCECWQDCPAPMKPLDSFSVEKRKEFRKKRSVALKAGKTSW